MKGWGPKSSVCPSKPMETKLLGGIHERKRHININNLSGAFLGERGVSVYA